MEYEIHVVCLFLGIFRKNVSAVESVHRWLWKLVPTAPTEPRSTKLTILGL